jgi:hypothetical protein
VDQAERDVGAGAPVEREDHARRGSQEADAEPPGEARQARGAGLDGTGALLGRLVDGPRPEPAEAADPAQPTEKA